MKTKSVAGIRRPCDLAGEEWAKPSTYWDVLCYKWANLKRFAYTADCKLISSFFMVWCFSVKHVKGGIKLL